MASKVFVFFNILEKNAGRLVRKTGLGSMVKSGLPDRISARLEVGSPRLLERPGEERRWAAPQTGTIRAAS
jgi:hypothetical protein